MSELHVVSALRTKRAEISGQVADLERQITRCRANLANIDATIRLFAPTLDPETIQPKRTYRRSRYFRKGEFAHLCLDELRKANGQPITTATIIAGVIKSKGLPEDLAAALTEKTLTYLRIKLKSGDVVKTGTTQDTKWVLVL